MRYNNIRIDPLNEKEFDIMEIRLSENLQKLRTEKKCTQEDIANALHITPQAVSKWERAESLPDIALLPRLACFFNVTVDDLLGVEESRKREKISEYKNRSRKLHNTGKISGAVKLWRKALEEFPEDTECLDGLMNSLHFLSNDEKSPDDYREIVSIAEKILSRSTDEKFRRNATQILVYDLPLVGRTEEAEKLAESAPTMVLSSQVFLEYICKIKGDNEKGRQVCIDAVLTFLEMAVNLFYDLCIFNKDDPEYCIRIHETYIRLCDTIFDDGFYGFYNCFLQARHYWLAKLYTDLHNDEEKARYHLKKAAECALAYDRLPQKYTYRSSIFGGGYEYDMSCTSRNSDKTVAFELLCQLDGKGLGDSVFDRWREKDWFGDIVKQLGG